MKVSSISLTAALMLAQSSFAGVITYDAFLTGPNEAPPNVSQGTGIGNVVIDDVANTMVLHMDFTGLLGTNHCFTHTLLHRSTGRHSYCRNHQPQFCRFSAGRDSRNL